MNKAKLPLYLFKLGGSLITDKTKLNSFRTKAVKKLFLQLGQFYDFQKHRLLIGNGAGSNTHYLAAKYQTMQGSRTLDDWQGSCKVKESALRHHSMLNQLALEADLPIFSFSPSSMFFSQKGRTKTKPNFSSLLFCLQSGLVPHIYGDVIFDARLGTTIYSTEKLFLELLPVLKQQYSVIKIFLLGDTQGVLDHKKQTISVIRGKDLLAYQQHLGSSAGFDVTGGMKNKVNQALLMANLGCEVYIASGIDFNIKILTTPKRFKTVTRVIA